MNFSPKNYLDHEKPKQGNTKEITLYFLANPNNKLSYC